MAFGFDGHFWARLLQFLLTSRPGPTGNRPPVAIRAHWSLRLHGMLVVAFQHAYEASCQGLMALICLLCSGAGCQASVTAHARLSMPSTAFHIALKRVLLISHASQG